MLILLLLFIFFLILYVHVCFPSRGPIHSLHHPTSPLGPTRPLPGGPALTLNPPESPTNSSELRFSWWSTQVRNGW